jgi:predicted aminopeptidase
VFRALLELDRVRVARLTAVYRELEALYASQISDKDKLAKKRALMRAVRAELDLSQEPNNASLLGFKTYNSGLEELAALRSQCQTWAGFFAAIAKLETRSFPREQEEDIGPVITRLASTECRRSEPAATARAASRR